ncbi:MAG: ribosome maturation factor RimM [Bacillota bacterium]
MSDEAALISVGEIINTHGVRGEVRVRPLTDFPERFQKDCRFILDRNGEARMLTVEKVRPYKNVLLVKFREIPDLNTAERIKGGLLKITKDQLAALPEDTFFIFEIIGMEVFTRDGRALGKVKDVISLGANDVYVVAGEFKEYMIPAVKEVVKQVDRQSRMIIIDPPQGLLDL